MFTAVLSHRQRGLGGNVMATPRFTINTPERDSILSQWRGLSRLQQADIIFAMMREFEGYTPRQFRSDQTPAERVKLAVAELQLFKVQYIQPKTRKNHTGRKLDKCVLVDMLIQAVESGESRFSVTEAHQQLAASGAVRKDVRGKSTVTKAVYDIRQALQRWYAEGDPRDPTVRVEIGRFGKIVVY